MSAAADMRQLHVIGRTSLGAGEYEIHLRPAQRRLVTILALAYGEAVPAQMLIDRMWRGSPPETARNALQVHVAGVRRSAPQLIATAGDGYRIDTASTVIDAAAFDRLAARAIQAHNADRSTEAIDAANDALELWHGEPFALLLDDSFADPERARLTETMLQLIELRIARRMAEGETEGVIPELEGLVAEYPFRERFWEFLMLSRYRVGRQAEALRAYREVSRILGEQLGVEPGPRLQLLEHDILMHVPDPASGPVTAPHALPTIDTPTIGRAELVDHIADLAREGRVVTIVGGPGVGKSRVAAEVGWKLLPAETAGVHMVELRGLARSQDIAARIATTLKVSDAQGDLTALGQSLDGRPGVLILDGAESVLTPMGEFLAAATRSAGGMRVIVTSRARIGVPTEVLVEVPPLTVPEAGATLAEVLEAPAVQMLLDRARAVSPGFQIAEADGAALVDVCRTTAGIPLALELVARWLPSLGARAVSELQALGRDESIEMAIDSSFRLLTPFDQRMLLRLAVANAPADLATVHGINPELTLHECAGSVVRLAESSLLTTSVGVGGRVRYGMLDPIREFGVERLNDDGDFEAATAAHADWFFTLGQSVAGMSLDTVDTLMPDFRTAMRHLMNSGANDHAMSIALALRWYWDARYQTWEALQWLDELLLDSGLRTQRLEALWSAGWMGYNNHDYGTALGRYRACGDLAREMGNRAYVGKSLFGIGRIGLPVNRLKAERVIADALRISREVGARSDEVACLRSLGISQAWRGESDSAASLLDEALALAGEDADPRHRYACLRYLSLAAFHGGRQSDAEGLAREAEQVARASGDTRGLSGALIQRALVDVTAGRVAAAAEAMAEALQPLPDTARIDHALVLLGTIPVLVEAGDLDRARRVFAAIDAIYAEYGWAPVASVNPVATHYHAEIGDIPEATSVDHVALRHEMITALEERATGRQ